MASHDSEDLSKPDLPDKRSILTSISSQLQYRKGDFSKLSFERNQSQTSVFRIEELTKEEKMFSKERVEGINRNLDFLASLRK